MGVIITDGCCEDSDQGCVFCAGRCTRDSEVTLYRIDMIDQSGTEFCVVCAEDALQSGCFRTS